MNPEKNCGDEVPPPDLIITFNQEEGNQTRYQTMQPGKIKKLLERPRRIIKIMTLVFKADAMGSTIIEIDNHTYKSNFEAFNMVEALIKICKNVWHFTVEFVGDVKDNFPKDSFQKLIDAMKSLTYVTLESKSSGFKLDNMLAMEKWPKSLDRFDLTCCDFENEKTFCLFLQGLTNLKGLKLKDTNMITEDVFSVLTRLPKFTEFHLFGSKSGIPDSSKKLISQLTNLKYLAISDKELSDNVLLEICSACSQIDEFNLAGCSKITSAELNKGISLLPKLKTLHLYQMDLSSLQGHKNIEFLFICVGHNASENSLSQAVKGSPKLQRLDVAYCLGSNCPTKLVDVMLSIAVARKQNFLVTDKTIFFPEASKGICLTVFKKNMPVASVLSHPEDVISLNLHTEFDAKKIVNVAREHTFCPGCEPEYLIRLYGYDELP